MDPATPLEPASLPVDLETRAYAIFLELEPSERAPAFAALCEQWPDHRRDLQQLWAELAQSDAAIRMGTVLAPPAQVGPYQIVRELGRGGCGVVYLAAQQQPIERQVAVKLILPGLHSHRLLLRFQRERQALARLSHPGIAQVYDAGTTAEGRPFVAMEYVPGTTITAHADQHRLPLQARIELFLQVCDGVQHAHQRGLLHRDLKPSNLLVAEVDGRPVAKVIDFGLAKVMQKDRLPDSLQTLEGHMLGTPDYMSPEQAAGETHDLDTRTDIYSLGVVLYELLVGVLPFELRVSPQLPLERALRRIREQEAPRPASRLSAVEGQVEGIAAARRLDRRALARALRGDLEWILLQALAKDRERRYRTVAQFADDLRRHLDSEPVQAAPPDLWYRARKFARRYRVQVTAGALLLLVALGGLIALSQVEAAGRRKEAVARREAEFGRYTADIAAAQAASAIGKPDLARQHLDACPAPLRNFEWRLFSARLQGAVRTKEIGKGVRSQAFSPDSTLLATGLDGGKLVVEPVQGGAAAVVLQAHASASVHGLAFTADGTMLATGAGKSVRLWHTKTWQEARTFEVGHDIGRLGISADGRFLATLCWSGPVTVLQLDGEGRFELATPASTFSELAFHPTRPLLALDTQAGQVQLYDLLTRERVASAQLSDSSELHHHTMPLLFLDGGERLVTLLTDGSVAAFELPGFRRCAHVDIGEIGIGMALVPDGRLAVGSYEGTIRMLDLAAEKVVASYADRGGWVQSLTASGDGRWLASGTNRGTVCLWSAADVRGIDELERVQRGATRLAASPDGRTLAIGSGDHDIHLVDVASGQECGVLHGHGDIVANVAFAPGGRRLVSAGDDGTCRLWDLEASTSKVLEQRQDLVRDAVFHPHRPWVACGGDNSPVHVLDVDTGTCLHVLKGPAGVCSLRFSTDGARLLAGGNDGSVWLWETATFTGQCLQKARGESDAFAAFSPDGRLLAMVTAGNQVTLLDGSSLQPLHALRLHEGTVSTVPVFSSDHQRLFTVGTDNNVRIWDVARGACVCTLGGHREWIVGLAIDPKGQWVATADNLGHGRIWHTAPLAEQIASREQARADQGAAEAFLDTAFAQGTEADAACRQAEQSKLSASVREQVRRLCAIRRGNGVDLAARSFELAASPRSGESWSVALRLARAAVGLRPQSRLSQRALGTALLRNGEHATALAALQSARELADTAKVTEPVSARYLEVLCLLHLGRTSEAGQVLAAIEQQAADSTEPWLPALVAEVAAARK